MPSSSPFAFRGVRGSLAALVLSVTAVLAATGIAAWLGARGIDRDTVAAFAKRSAENEAVGAATSLRAAIRQTAYLYKAALLASHDGAKFAAQVAELERGDGAVRKQQAELAQRAKSVHLDVQAALAETAAAYAEAHRRFASSLALVVPGRPETAFAADRASAGAERPAVAAASKLAERMRDQALAAAREDAARLEASSHRNLVVLAALLAVAMVACALASLAVGRKVLRQLGGEPDEAVALAQSIASGDLTRPVRVAPGDRSSLLAALDRMREELRAMLERMAASAAELTEASKGVSAASTQVTSATQVQSEAAASMAAAVEQMTVSIDMLKQHSEDALKVARHAGDLSNEGDRAVRGNVDEMGGIASSADELMRIIRELGGQSGRISSIA